MDQQKAMQTIWQGFGLFERKRFMVNASSKGCQEVFGRSCTLARKNCDKTLNLEVAKYLPTADEDLLVLREFGGIPIVSLGAFLQGLGG
ncbi:MAG: hypothetical protein N3D11_16215 [Candidatus Sumerlaeia bacterium]|nr:hypothetical protein [Candidatus Sumerlaeia bacterium]